ncbi:MAG: hypothetical protein ACLSX5_10920 [Lachnospiraceae bacterium]
MNLQPFYELRDRLHTAANAGVNLIMEDFRLQRAAAAVEPFAKASPVFAKIDQMLKKMLSPDCADRALVLLDILALLDAVLVTQGINQAPGELERILGDVEEDFFGHYKNIPASVLRPLKQAMTGTGGGRYNIIEETHRNYPEVFDDYRVQKLMIKGLGDSYSELASLYADWLSEKGEKVLPLLKEEFDPAGKREMVHRVHIIAKLAGEKENEFYVSQLPESKKEVREALIEALRFSPSNAPLLLQLIKTEKGRTKAAAQWASGYMDIEENRTYWQKTEANPLILGDSPYRWAADLQAKRLLKLAEKVTDGSVDVIKYSDEEKILLYLQALKGKKITDFETWIQKLAAIACKFKYMKSEKGITSFQQGDLKLEQDGFAEALSKYLMDTLFLLQEEVNETGTDDESWEYMRMAAGQAKQLEKEYGVLYRGAGFAAAFLTEPKDQVFREYGNCLQDKGVFCLLSRLKYSRDENTYMYEYRRDASWKGEYQSNIQIRTGRELSLDWYPDIFKKQKGNSHEDWDRIIRALFRTDTEKLRNWYGYYFYLRVCRVRWYGSDLELLKECGWKDFKGILKKRILMQDMYWIHNITADMGLSREEIIEEMKEAKAQMSSSQASLSARIDAWIEQLNNGASISELT